jgi:nitroreductase
MSSHLPRSLLLSSLFLSTLILSPSIGEASSSEGHILNVIQQRHSGRSYDEKGSVSSTQLRTLIEAARWAPSCYGDEPWRFIVCHKTTHPEAYNKVLNALVEFNQNWARHAPALIVVVARTQFKKNDQENRWGPYDTGAAAEHILLQATSMGLMGHQMGGFDEGKIKADFGIEGPYEVMSVIAIGHEVKNPPAEEKNRSRQPLEKIFFEGKWMGD